TSDSACLHAPRTEYPRAARRPSNDARITTRGYDAAAPIATGREESMRDLVDMLFGTYPSWSHLVVRLVLGIVFFAHGAQKTFGWFGGRGLSATVAGFRQMNIPPAAATLAALVECLGGLALIVGFLARPAALGLIVVM